jgi:hypothetical protein
MRPTRAARLARAATRVAAAAPCEHHGAGARVIPAIRQCGQSLRLEDRQHFMRYATHVMRSVVDIARQPAQRRGGMRRTSSTPYMLMAARHGALQGEQIIRVHEALEGSMPSTRASCRWWRCVTSPA